MEIGRTPLGPRVRADDLAEVDDLFEESLLEAAACGDVGFADRMLSSWWPELDDGPPPGWGE